MKKLVIIVAALFSSFSSFAYYGYSSRSDEMSPFEIFTLIVMIVCIIISIFLLVRWWKMTSHIREIKEFLTHNNANPKLTYLIAICEPEKARKEALIMMIDNLMPMYFDQYDYDKVDSMNKYISEVKPQIEKLGIVLPEYVKSGENFIDYLNNLTGNNVPYHTSNTTNTIYT